MFGLGPWEIAVIAGAVLLVAGPAVLPRLGRTFGKTVTGLRESAESFSTNLREEMEADRRERDALPASVEPDDAKSTDSADSAKNPTAA